MKKITLLLFLFVSSVIYSQKNGISYQAVIFNPNGGKVPGINNSNEPLANKNICLQFTIIDSDSRTEYQETINTTTDAFGMVNTIIGSGNQSAGYAASFSNIYWTSDQKSLKVAMDINGKCSSFVEISNQLFTSVPSAFSAQNAENVTGVVPIESGGTNAVTVLGAKTNLALEKVDNTSDLSKPISTATQIILNLKEDSANKSTDLIIDANSNVKYPTVQAVKTYIDANTSTGSAGLAAETARATAAESANANAIAANTTAITTNANAIAAEAATARAAELALTNNLATEATTARAAELANATAITAETNRATAAEATKENTDNKSIDGTFASNSDVKFPTEKAVKTYVDASVSTTSTALATEVARATAAEGVLTTSIANEASTRGTADATLTTNLNAEVSRATAAEGVLTTSIANEASTRGTAVATLITNLNAEITRATAAETANANAITTETNRATTAETGLTSSLALKVDKISGKGLSTEDYSSAEKIKLAAITGTNTGDQDLSAYAPLASPTFTGTVLGITKTMVGLGNVDNTTDLLKPISTATQSALDLKANLVSPTFTGTVTASGTLTSGVVTYPNSHGTSGQFLSTTGSGTLAWTTPSTTANAYSGVLPLANGGTGSATQNFVDLSTTQTVVGAKTFSSAVTGSSFVKSGGTSIQYLMADGTVSSGPREVNAEFTATASQTNFTVAQTPLTGRIIKMYVNGVRISNTACSFSGTTLTYIPSNNGNYNLTAGDRIQIDFYY